MLLFGRDNPIASPTQAMVLAVNCPPHAPCPGQATFSSAVSCASGQLPASNWPTASNTSTTVTSLSWNRPGRIDPPYTKILGTFRRSIDIIMPGRLLSHPANPISAS